MRQKNLRIQRQNLNEDREKHQRGKYILRLYVAGMTTKSKQAIQNIKQICEEHLKDRC